MEIPKKYLKEVKIEGLKGRVLHLPDKKKRKNAKTLLLIPGQHTSHERLYGICQYLNDYGEVYSIDLPGFGGMDSFYSIGKEPSFDNYAAYIYTIIKTLKLDKKNLWIVGNSVGFLYTTRMLQLHPEMIKSVNHLISLVGFTGGKDFKFTPAYMKHVVNAVSLLGQTRIGVGIAKVLILNRFTLKVMLTGFAKVKARMKQENYTQGEIIDMEIHLWTDNDQRTHAKTAWDMINKELPPFNKKLPFDVVNITSKEDQYFEPEKVEKGMLEKYRGYKTVYLKLDAHSPSIIGSPEDFGKAIPKEVEKLLSKR